MNALRKLLLVVVVLFLIVEMTSVSLATTAAHDEQDGDDDESSSSSSSSEKSSIQEDTTTCLQDDDEATAAAATTTTTIFTPLGPPDEYMNSSCCPQSGGVVRLAVRRWEPPSASSSSQNADDEIKCVLIVLHGGVGWHSGYFNVLGTALASSNIAVVAYDQIGSGYSDGMTMMMNGRRRYRQYFDSMHTLTRDVGMVISNTKERYHGKPIFVLGESFGGMVLLHYMLQQQQRNGQQEGQSTTNDGVKGYILTGPVIRLRDEMLPPNLVQRMVKVVARFFPHWPMPGIDFMSTFDDAFGDKRWAEAGRADPFVQEAASTPPRLGMIASVLTASSDIGTSMQNITLPFVIFVGQDDVRVRIPDSQELYRTASSTDKTLTVVPGGKHQLFQDQPNVTQYVIEGIQSWILARC